MDIFKTPLVILFKNQNPYRILQDYFYDYTRKKSSHEKIDERIFIDLYQEEENQFSKDDAKNIYYIVNESMERNIGNIDFNKSVFNILINYSEKILENCGDAVRCKYKDLLKWRYVSLKIDQDLFICSFLASQDIYMRKDRQYFDWDVIIKSNNIRLHNTLSKGMSENHFHLKGSAPTFKLSWVSLMNDINCRKIDAELDSLNRLEKDIDGEVKIEDCIVIAAIIRAILFKEINGVKSGAAIKSNLMDILKEIIIKKDKENTKYGINKEFISMYTREINNEISSLRYILGADLKHNSKKVKVDYAITKDIYINDKSTQLFSGERSFMYSCFKKIYSNDEKFMEKADLFYAYLILKNKVRAELVQENKRVGFANFSDYQDRKCMYLKKGKILADSVEPLAILTSVQNQNLKSLEARVIPKLTSYENINLIKDTDNRICNKIYNDKNNHWIRNYDKNTRHHLLEEDLSQAERKILFNDNELKEFNKINMDLKDKYFYVYHFPKKEDKQEKKDELYKIVRCRHYTNRRELKKVCIAIEKMREKNQHNSDRILGIDACSNELVTRPEVYGQAFRFLKGHLPSDDYNKELFNRKSLQRLRATYHVGEDFLDIIDGLRAIDEAIEFLELTHGDRLGHAIVLGIDVKEWYKQKYNRVYLSKQEVLDNIAWLISKIKIFNIKSGPDTIDKLISIFNSYYVDIYTDKYDGFSFEEDNKNRFDSALSVVPVDTYISAWKLRGDNPEMYLNENKNNQNLGYWNRCAIRKGVQNKLINELYRRYHYDDNVKTEGGKKVVFKIEPYMIDVIVEVQKCMQKSVRERGIGIETNPSSNVLISTFKRYDKHPILNMYNIGLGDKNNKEVPQLFVSINTDDQGVFDTLLENEYALMAIALEKVKDEKGNSIYNQAEIHDWIDKVREMGIEQSFRVILNN